MTGKKPAPKAKMVMIYSHHPEDRKDLKKSMLESSLRNLAKSEGIDFWWDIDLDKSHWDEEIKRRLDEADIILCMVSEAFLASDYISRVESRITSRRARGRRALAVPVLLKPSSWEQHAWLRELHHFPTDRPSMYRHPNRYAVYQEITNYIRKWLGRRGPVLAPEVLRGLRRLRESNMDEEQLGILTNDSCRRAKEAVRNAALRKKIEQAARQLKGADKSRTLSKEELAQLDEQFLAGGRRKSDPKYVRWVLRCAGLHPQGAS